MEIWTNHFRPLKLVTPLNYMSVIHEKLLSAIESARETPFAFFFRNATYANSPSAREGWTDATERDWERMGLIDAESWTVASFNEDFSLCPTYPQYHLLPPETSAQDLAEIAAFRQGGRFPSCVWQHPANSSVILRCAPVKIERKNQPCPADQQFFLQLLRRCPHLFILYEGKNPASRSETNYSESFSSGAVEIETAGLEQSFLRLEGLCRSVYDVKKSEHVQATWLTQLEKTEWTQYVSRLLDYAVRLANLIQNGTSILLVEGESALLNKVPLLISLTLLMVDPFYRSIAGFQTLIDVHWLSFGHSFSQSHAKASKQPFLFTLWMDCVFNMRKQFPQCFEFDDSFLITILDHVHSGLFGQFLHATELERKKAEVHARTCSLWHEINTNEMEFVNPQYSKSPYAIFPVTSVYKLLFWESYFLRWISNNPVGGHIEIQCRSSV